MPKQKAHKKSRRKSRPQIIKIGAKCDTNEVPGPVQDQVQNRTPKKCILHISLTLFRRVFWTFLATREELIVKCFLRSAANICSLVQVMRK